MSTRIRIRRIGSMSHCTVYRDGHRLLHIAAEIQPDARGYVIGEMYTSAAGTLDLPLARAVVAQLLHPLDWSRRDLRDRQYTVRALPEGQTA